jgi:hypothetical protein
MRILSLRVQAMISLLFAAIGIWLVVAPTAIGFQPATEPWVQAGYNDVVVGGLLVLCSLGLLVAQVTTVVKARLRAAARP